MISERAAQLRFQRVEQRQLAWKHQRASLVQAHPARLDNFRKTLASPAFRRPFDLELIRLDGRRIEIAFDREGFDDLAARLTDRRQREWHRRQLRPRLFLELAEGSFDGRFAFSTIPLKSSTRRHPCCARTARRA